MICTKRLTLALFVSSLPFAGPVLAQDVYIYATKGQGQQQQEKDKYECYNWARQQTGFDPMARPQATSPPPQQSSVGALGGAARGAAIGAVGGAIGGDAGKGAAIGAAAGGLFGGMRRRQEQRQHEQWQAQQQQAYGQRRNEYNRAFGACLSGRGYTVR